MLRRPRTNQQPLFKKFECSDDQDFQYRDTSLPEMPPDLSFSFDVSSDEEEETETSNNLLPQNAVETMSHPRSSLKVDHTKTTKADRDSLKCKRVRWKSHELVTDVIGEAGRSTNQLYDNNLKMSDVWLTRKDLDKMKQEEMSLYYRQASSSSSPSFENDENPYFPTAKMYLLECQGIYDWMETEFFSQPTTTLSDETSGIRKRKHSSCKQDNWTHEDFFRLVLHNSPALWNGWTYFRGMECARTRWRRVRNKATVCTILQLQRHKNAEELAVAASQLTAVDAIWAHFAAIGDEQQLMMDELDALQHEFDVLDSSEICSCCP